MIIAMIEVINHRIHPYSMIVCICNEVRERQIKTAIAMGVTSMEALKSELDVATCCGCCEPMVQDYFEEHHQSLEAYQQDVAFATTTTTSERAGKLAYAV